METMMRFRRSSLDQEGSRVLPAMRTRMGRTLAGLPRWAAGAGGAVVLVLSLVGVAVAGVFGDSGTAARAAGPGGPALPSAHRSGAAKSGAAHPGTAHPGTAHPGRSVSGGPAHARTAARAHPRALRTSCPAGGPI